MRTEKDNLGEVSLPEGALYGIQSWRARENFALGYKGVNLRLLYAIVKVKKAAALTYAGLACGPRDRELYRAVADACDRVLAGEADDMFVTDALQGGAGTSAHMNVNEVLANLA
ncbi:MAG: aspartate ammonia-lyase, partial [Spirochaetia bacterium]|nr:aspartate ammonia-lyase [Spirochaetia bacterium]